MTMEASTSDNINNADMAREYLVSPIKMSLWEHGKKTNSMAMEFMFMLMVRGIKANSRMGRRQGEAPTFIKVVQGMRANGKRIRKMDLEFSFIRIIRNIKEIG